jgi:hypothetical protein
MRMNLSLLFSDVTFFRRQSPATDMGKQLAPVEMRLFVTFLTVTLTVLSVAKIK